MGVCCVGGEGGGVDVDFDHFLTTYRHLLTLSLLDSLVAVVADTIKTTTPLEVKAVDVAVTEKPPLTRETSTFQFKAGKELVQRLYVGLHRSALLGMLKLNPFAGRIASERLGGLCSDLNHFLGQLVDEMFSRLPLANS